MAIAEQHMGAGAGTRAALPLYAATLFLSAFLLFSVQPFFAKMILPRLGGSPAVWSVAMVFFQAMLLAGYGYAHLLVRYLAPARAAIVHGAVMVLAFLVLPVAVPAGWETPPQSGQSLWLLGLFAVAVGLPFFAVSANGPLLQAWFARTGHAHAADPYFLYGASNIGSFASLILYIVLFEPGFTVGDQSLLWTAGFAVLAAAVGVCALLAAGGAPASAATPATAHANVRGRPLLWAPLVWAWYGFLPSGLLVAVTAHITLDVAAAPFLWVVPLALFLLTFVFAFRDRPLLPPRLVAGLVPLLGAATLASLQMAAIMPVWLNLGIQILFYFFAALHCHTLLYAARPAASGLTGFYLWMSAGGVLGGVFASLLAPVLFDWVAEYFVLIVAVMLVRPQGTPWRQWLSAAVVTGLVGITVGLLAASGQDAGLSLVIVALAAGAALAFLLAPRLYAAIVVALVPVGFVHAAGGGDLFRERTFFGIVRVVEASDGAFRAMMHGTTLHGAVRTAETGRPTPLTYYHESGGIAGAVRAMQARRGGAMAAAAAIGLGTGSVACHARPGEAWTFFEIDRAVVDAARDPALFPFLAACAPDAPVVLGDARLTIADQPARRFDLILVDAFSSDSIPAHLLTREALQLYRSRLKADGMIVFHISNRYLELESVTAALAASEGMAIRAGTFGERGASADTGYISASHVAVMAADEAMFGPLADDPRWQVPAAGATQPWTDDFSNIFTALLRRF